MSLSIILSHHFKLKGCPQIGYYSKLCQVRSISSSTPLNLKKEILREEELKAFDYGAVQANRKRIYVFGSVFDGALGLSSKHRPLKTLQRPIDFISRPVRNDFSGFRDVDDIEVGHGFTLVKVKERQKKKTHDHSLVYASGLNTHSQLGFQSARANVPMSVLLAFVPISLPTGTSKKVLCMGAGRAHTVISIEGEGLFTFGDNSSGQCGRVMMEGEEYFGSRFIHKIKQFTTNDEVISIASRFDLTLCLTRSGKVFSFGLNNQGQLGRGHRVIRTWEPGQVLGDLQGEKIIKLVTSGSSSLAISEKGDLFGWGSNQCGQVNPTDRGNAFLEPRKINLNHKIGKVVDVSTGDNFSHLVNERGDVYAWGQGNSLGLGPVNINVKTPTIIPPPFFGINDFNTDDSVIKVSSGFFYSAAITKSGNLYTWGKNESGCLGLGLHFSLTQHFPLRVSLIGFVEKVCLGVDHTVVLCKGGV